MDTNTVPITTREAELIMENSLLLKKILELEKELEKLKQIPPKN